MKKRWDVVAKTTSGEEVRMVLRGFTEEDAIKSGLEYQGICSIIKITERVVEKTFPEPPAHLLGVHYRPLRHDGKTFYG